MRLNTLLYSFLIFTLGMASCQKEEVSPNGTSGNDHGDYGECVGVCSEDHLNDNDKITVVDGKRWLWGGSDESWNFDISNMTLNLDNLKFGLGREFFKALMEPKFKNIALVNVNYREDDRMIVVEGNDVIKAYPIDLLIEHELINDVIEGEPVMVGYCVLADFPCVYSRNMCGQEFTFGVSGYTYSEPNIRDGRDGFVLWDRDTESLWWPLTNRSVSGGMKDKQFNKEIGHLTWDVVSWSSLKANKKVVVLNANQEMEPPVDYPRVEAAEICL